MKDDRSHVCISMYLLVASLHGAIALTEMHDISELITENLQLNVARSLDKLLDKYIFVLERLERLALASVEGLVELVGGEDGPHALAATARHGLDHHGVSDPLGLTKQKVLVLISAMVSGSDGHLGVDHDVLGFALGAHGPNRIRGRTDEDDSSVLAHLAEIKIFREKAVSRMHGLGPGALRGLDNLLSAQVGLSGSARSNVHGLVRELDMESISIGVRVAGNSLDAQSLSRADDSARDLSSVRDDNLVEEFLLRPRGCQGAGPRHARAQEGGQGNRGRGHDAPDTGDSTRG